jgi:hypothetical protein
MAMNGNQWQVDRLVRIALDALTPEEQQVVQNALASRARFDHLAKDPTKNTAVGHLDDVYALHVTPQLRLIYRKNESGVEVLDLVEQATLDFFARPTRRQQDPASDGQGRRNGAARGTPTAKGVPDE